MHVMRDAAEEQLVDVAYRLRSTSRPWRAVHFHLSRLTSDTLHKAHLTLALNTIRSSLPEEDKPEKNDEGIFVCADDDIIVLCCDRSKDILDKLIHNLRVMYAEDPIASGEESGEAPVFCTSYDICAEYEEFYFACNRKRNALRLAKERYEAALNPSMDVDMFSFARQLREKRMELQILLLEDDKFSAALIVNMLRVKHDIIVTDNARDALREYEKNAPDMVFLDIELPDISGLEVLKRLLEIDPEAFVVMESAHGYLANVKKAVELGARGFVAKPFSKSRIETYVEVCLAERRKRRREPPGVSSSQASG